MNLQKPTTLLRAYAQTGRIEAGCDEAGRGCLLRLVIEKHAVAWAVDGNRFKAHPSGIPHTCFVKGDALFASIAAASVLAKTHRDEYMEQQAVHFLHYEWESNKGYPTKEHRNAIAQWGVSPLHRKSFKLLPEPRLF